MICVYSYRSDADLKCQYRCALLFSMSLKSSHFISSFSEEISSQEPCNEKLILDRIEYLKQFLSLAELNAVDL